MFRRIKAAGINYRSAVRGPEDMRINTAYGGRMVYWNEPDGHQWEVLTVSYACAPTRLARRASTPTTNAVDLNH